MKMKSSKIATSQTLEAKLETLAAERQHWEAKLTQADRHAGDLRALEAELALKVAIAARTGVKPDVAALDRKIEATRATLTADRSEAATASNVLRLVAEETAQIRAEIAERDARDLAALQQHTLAELRRQFDCNLADAEAIRADLTTNRDQVNPETITKLEALLKPAVAIATAFATYCDDRELRTAAWEFMTHLCATTQRLSRQRIELPRWLLWFTSSSDYWDTWSRPEDLAPVLARLGAAGLDVTPVNHGLRVVQLEAPRRALYRPLAG
jgi:hypothetical protein